MGIHSSDLHRQCHRRRRAAGGLHIGILFLFVACKVCYCERMVDAELLGVNQYLKLLF